MAKLTVITEANPSQWQRLKKAWGEESKRLFSEWTERFPCVQAQRGLSEEPRWPAKVESSPDENQSRQPNKGEKL